MPPSGISTDSTHRDNEVTPKDPAMADTQRFFTAISLILLFMIAAPKQHYWWADTLGMHQDTETWQPYRQYSIDVEQALSILQTTEPAEVAYFRSRGFPVEFVPGTRHTMGQTTPLGIIGIPYRFENQPAQLAVVLSHELIHEQRHDPFTNPPKYPLWRRLLWHQGEEVAHCKSIWVALKLWPQHHDVWDVMGYEWIFEPFLYWFVGPICLLDVTALLILAYAPLKTFVQWITPRISYKQAASATSRGEVSP